MFVLCVVQYRQKGKMQDNDDKKSHQRRWMSVSCEQCRVLLQVEVSAMGRSLVQGSCTECESVSMCDKVRK